MREEDEKLLTIEYVYQRSITRDQEIGDSYNLIVRWEHENLKALQKIHVPEREIKLYHHFIVYDFESLFNKEKIQITEALIQRAIHIPCNIRFNS